jgi:single-strand DNA-binding protein
MDLNNVSIIGRLTKDPVKRTLSSGKELAEFAIANNRGFGDFKRAHFIDVKFWGKGLSILPFLRRGTKIAVTGELLQDSWTDQMSGQKRQKLYINTFSVDILEQPKEYAEDGPPETVDDDIPY